MGFTVSILQLLTLFSLLSLVSATALANPAPFPDALSLPLANPQSNGEDCNQYCTPMSNEISRCAKAHGLLNEDGSQGPETSAFPEAYKSCLCDGDTGFMDNYVK